LFDVRPPPKKKKTRAFPLSFRARFYRCLHRCDAGADLHYKTPCRYASDREAERERERERERRREETNSIAGRREIVREKGKKKKPSLDAFSHLFLSTLPPTPTNSNKTDHRRPRPASSAPWSSPSTPLPRRTRPPPPSRPPPPPPPPAPPPPSATPGPRASCSPRPWAATATRS